MVLKEPAIAIFEILLDYLADLVLWPIWVKRGGRLPFAVSFMDRVDTGENSGRRIQLEYMCAGRRFKY